MNPFFFSKSLRRRPSIVLALVVSALTPLVARAQSTAPPVAAERVEVALTPRGDALGGVATWTLDVSAVTDSILTLRWYAGPMRIREASVMLPDTTVRMLTTERSGDSVSVMLRMGDVPRPLPIQLTYSVPLRYALFAESDGPIRWLGSERGAPSAWLPHLEGAPPAHLALDLSAFDTGGVEALGGVAMPLRPDSGATVFTVYENTVPGDVLVAFAPDGDVLRVAAATFPVRLLGVPESSLDQVTYDVERITGFLADRFGVPFPHEGLTLGYVDRLAPFARAGAGVALLSADGLRTGSSSLEGLPTLMLAEALAWQWLAGCACPAARLPDDARHSLSALTAFDYLADTFGDDVADPLLFTARRYMLAGQSRPATADAARTLRALWRGHQARQTLGDEAFTDRLRTLAAPSPASLPQDLARALTAQPHAGDIQLRATYDADARGVALEAARTPARDSTLAAAAQPPVEVAVTTLAGSEIVSVPTRDTVNTAEMTVPFRPRSYTPDPDLRYPGRVALAQAPSAWVSILLSDAPTASRLIAADALGRSLMDTAFVADGAIRLALADALAREPSPTVIGTLLASVALADSALAQTMLAEALRDPFALVREAALRTLGRAHAELLPDALTIASADSSLDVIAEAVRAAGRLAPSDERTEALVRSALVTPSPGDLVQAAGLQALAGLSLSTNELEKLAYPFSEAGTSSRLLAAAAEPLAIIAETRSDARRRLTQLGNHPDPLVRLAAYRGLARAGTGNALKALAGFAETERHPGLLALIQRLSPSR